MFVGKRSVTRVKHQQLKAKKIENFENDFLWALALAGMC